MMRPMTKSQCERLSKWGQSYIEETEKHAHLLPPGSELIFRHAQELFKLHSFKDLIKNIENFIQVKNYSMQYFFDWVKEDSYYLYLDQDSEQLLAYMLNQTLKFAALIDIIVEVMHDDEFEEKQKLLMRSSHTDTQWNYIIKTFNMLRSNINISLRTQQ